MNAENFAEYIKQPAKLYQLSYQELKNLATEYPYVATIRLLLVLKSKIENDGNYQHYLHQLAARTFDRAHLQRLLQHEITQIMGLEAELEEKLELKGLEELQEELIEWVVESDEQQLEAPAAQQAAAIPIPEEDDLADEDLPQLTIDPDLKAAFAGTSDAEENGSKTNAQEPPATPAANLSEEITPYLVPAELVHNLSSLAGALDQLSFEPVAETPAPEQPAEASAESETTPAIEETPSYRAPEEVVHNISSLAEALEQLSFEPDDEPVTGEQPAPSNQEAVPMGSPMPKTAFDSWKQRTSDNKNERLRRLREHRQPKRTKPAKSAAKKIAKRSIQNSPALVSETLAKLLADQGQYDKSIKMYERLSLLFPQKSRYFAGIIENLKQKS